MLWNAMVPAALLALHVVKIKMDFQKKINKSIFAVILFALAGIILFNMLPNEKNIDFSGNSLKTDYVKVSITWSPPNNAPSFSDGPAENPASTSSSPTNVGSAVSFYATGTDPDGDQYYLAICKSAAISAGSNATPTCTGGAWCYSGPTNSGAQSSCSTTTLAAWNTQNDWYGYVCDKKTGALCSSSSQGSGSSGSPFDVNHLPADFTSPYAAPTPLDPGDVVNFWVTTQSSSEPDGDAVNLFFCKTQSANSSGCISAQWCNQTECGAECSCESSAPIPSEGTQNFYVYIFDEHGLGASNNGALGTFTVNNVGPSVSNVTVNGGAAIDLSDGGEGIAGNKNINITADVTDNNGCDDIVSVAVRAYPTGIGSGGCTSQNNNNCYYNISCTEGSCSDSINQAYTCTVNFKYHADPTDAGSVREAETWKATVAALDEGASGSAESASGVELQSFVALLVTPNISYGNLAIGEIANTTPLPQTATVSATGNVGLDVNLSGTNMTSGGNSILASQQKYATSAVQYQNAISLSGTPTFFNLRLPKTTTTATLSATTTFWGLQVPSGSAAGEYSGTNTFTAVKSNLAQW